VHVDHVDIKWLESLTLEGRASYYHRAGAMKDMVQNHLMEAMALVLMEQPARMDAGSFRGVRVEGLRAVATPAAETMRSQTVRGRDTAGTIGTRQVPCYVDEPGVDPSRNTETYACRTLQVNSPRWHRGPVHPAFGQGSGGGLGRDRHPAVMDLPVAAERAPSRAGQMQEQFSPAPGRRHPRRVNPHICRTSNDAAVPALNLALGDGIPLAVVPGQEDPRKERLRCRREASWRWARWA
jgi:Glucose-6-phosphate dehydrogenase, C-terminal domain